MDQDKFTRIIEISPNGKEFLEKTFKHHAIDLPEYEYDQLIKLIKDIIRMERIDAAYIAIESFPNTCI